MATRKSTLPEFTGDFAVGRRTVKDRKLGDRLCCCFLILAGLGSWVWLISMLMAFAADLVPRYSWGQQAPVTIGISTPPDGRLNVSPEQGRGSKDVEPTRSGFDGRWRT